MLRSISLLGSLSLAIVMMLGSAQPAQAQHDAAWKSQGMQGESQQGFQRRMSHAADYARDLSVYVAPPQTPTPAAVKAVVTELGNNLQAAKLHLAAMKSSAGDDKATLAAIQKIETHLDMAFAHHKSAHACCVEDFNSAKALTCCKDLTKEIEAIQAEHNALMNTLAVKKVTVSKPVAK